MTACQLCGCPLQRMPLIHQAFPMLLRLIYDPAQVGLGRMVSLLLQVCSQLADVGAILFIRCVCRQSRSCLLC